MCSAATIAYNLCFIVPIYEHGQQFKRLWPELRAFGLATILIDDGSGEDTVEIIKELMKEEPLLHHVRHAINRGKGAAVKTGLKQASQLGFSHAFQIDADGQHDLGAIEVFLKTSHMSPDALITGYPVFNETVSLSRRWGRLITTFWMWVETLSLKIKDGMCGFRIYPLHRVLPVIQSSRIGDRMDFDIAVLVRSFWNDIELVQLPVKTVYPEDGYSNFRLGMDNLIISWAHANLVIAMLCRFPRLFFQRLRKG